MTTVIDSTGAADTREQTYRLLASRAPAKVVIDTALRDGEWYVVRAPEPYESARIARGSSASPGAGG